MQMGPCIGGISEIPKEILERGFIKNRNDVLFPEILEIVEARIWPYIGCISKIPSEMLEYSERIKRFLICSLWMCGRSEI